MNDTSSRIRALLDRLQRLIASDDWADELNPAQRSALAYLARANRFSRSPSHVADYLCTTRGTASQTLKALEKKDMIGRAPSDADRRSVSYEVTSKGRSAVERTDALDKALDRMGKENGLALEKTLSDLIGSQLKARQFRSFGLCRTCRYHDTSGPVRRCRLLNVTLQDEEAEQVCHEHVGG